MKDGLLKQQDVSEQDKRWKNGDLIEHKSQIILFNVWLWRNTKKIIIKKNMNKNVLYLEVLPYITAKSLTVM